MPNLLAQVVEEINSEIKKRKNQLAPQIKDLRSLRAKFQVPSKAELASLPPPAKPSMVSTVLHPTSARQHTWLGLIPLLRMLQEVEAEYLEKKALYDNAKAGVESDLSKLQLEADAAEKECQHEESRALYFESMIKIDQVKKQRAEVERAGKFERQLPDGTVVHSYRGLLEAKIKQQEALSKELRDRQKDIKENYGAKARQVHMFKDLHKLLRCKLESQQRARQEAKSMMAENQQDTNVFTMPDNDDVPAGTGFGEGSPYGRGNFG